MVPPTSKSPRRLDLWRRPDTILFNSFSAEGVLSGGNGGDLIGNSALDLGANRTALIDGGAGHDTINLFSSNSTAQSIFGGAGLDSITFFGTGDGSVNGGAGDDTINYSVPGAISTAAAGLSTINGGAGADRFCSAAGLPVLTWPLLSLVQFQTRLVLQET